MSFLEDLAFLFRLVTESNRFSKLAMLSDRQLAARGLERQRLVRGYLREIGAH